MEIIPIFGWDVLKISKFHMFIEKKNHLQSASYCCSYGQNLKRNRLWKKMFAHDFFILESTRVDLNINERRSINEIMLF